MLMRIGFRNVLRQKRRSVLTVLTMFGGFTLAAISIGWSDGTYSNIIEMFTRDRLGHIQVHHEGYLDRPSLYKTIDDSEAVGAIISDIEGVEQWTPRVFSSGLASAGEKSAGVQIIGIDPSRESATTHFDKKIISGRTFSTEAAREVVLGQGLGEILKVSPGDSVVIVSQGADGSIANDIYVLVGLVDAGDKMTNQTAFYLHLHDAQELLVLEGRVHEIAIVAEDLKEVVELAEVIQGKIADPKLVVEPWQVFARAFYQAMKADQQGTWIMLLLIMLVVAVGVLNTVLMTVLERTREFGVLRAVGTAPSQIIRLVIFEITVMAIIGIILGCGASYLVNYWLSIEGVALPTAFTYGGMEYDRMFTEINARSFYIPALTVLFSAMLVSIFPAIKAARIAPARAMRIR